MKKLHEKLFPMTVKFHDWNHTNTMKVVVVKYPSLYSCFFFSRKLMTDNLVSIWKHLTSVVVNIKTQLLRV